MQKIEKNRDPIIIKSNPLISPSPKNSFSSSSSSSDFEFTVSISPRKSSTVLCPADELFCNGHLLPLHSRRNSLVPTLLPSSSTSSSADSATTSASRDSTGSSSTDSRSSSQNDPTRPTSDDLNLRSTRQRHDKKCKQFSFSRFSSVFRKEPKNNSVSNHGGESRPPRVKGIGSTAKEVIKKCFRKVQLKIGSKSCHSAAAAAAHAVEAAKDSSLNSGKTEEGARFSLSFSGNLRYPRGRSSFLPSCPSSTRSSPSHSGVLRRGGVQSMSSVGGYGSSYSADMSSMEELHSAIQGAIAHCKNSLIQNKNTINPDESSSSQIVP